MKEKEPLEIIVVEDTTENLMAVYHAFPLEGEDEPVVEVYETLEDGLKALQSKTYALGIFDLYMPEKKGKTPEPLGIKLAAEASKQRMPWAILTSGFYKHHGVSNAAFAIYHYMLPRKDEEYLDQLISKAISEGFFDSLQKFGEVYEHMGKHERDLWRVVYRQILLGGLKDEGQNYEIGKENIRELWESRKRYHRYIGKVYREKD